MSGRPGDPVLQMVTPLPPLQTGIAQYSRDLLGALDGRWQVRVVAERGSMDRGPWSTIDVATMRRAGRLADLPTVYQLGNSGFHRIAFEASLRRPGVAVLHDTVLHHGRLASMLRGRGAGDYRRLMRMLYGDDGERAALDAAAGKIVDLNDFPLVEDIVAGSRLVVVHSDYARDKLLARCPDAAIVRVPMGIPLPDLTDQAAARRLLEIPDSTFVVASVTHVNPFKRLPVVLRAVRMLRHRIPELILVIAGSSAPGIDLARQAHAYGVSDQVRLLGYVGDDVARLVARASDVCVNLRFPSAGETSASLLRLMGAGRPVLVTRDASTVEYPSDAVLPVDVGPFEDELVAELLLLLYGNDELRQSAGNAARRFIEAEHGVGRMAAGYRDAIHLAFGLDFAPVADITSFEPPVVTERGSPTTARAIDPPSAVDRDVARAMTWLGIDDRDDTIQSVSAAMVALRLDRLRDERKVDPRMTDTSLIRTELLEILACPACKARVRLEDEELICEGCGRRYPIEDGIPIMLIEAAQ